MRMIYESDPDEDFFEFILDEQDILDLYEGKGSTEVFKGELYGIRNLNVFIRKENQ